MATAPRAVGGSVIDDTDQLYETIEALKRDVRQERIRTDKAQAEAARRGDVMLAALSEIERGDYNAAARLLADVVRP